jgi:hypothetical protein
MNIVYDMYIPCSRYQVGLLIFCMARWSWTRFFTSEIFCENDTHAFRDHSLQRTNT